MTVFTAIPKGLKKFTKITQHKSVDDPSVTLIYDKPNLKQTKNGVVGRDFIHISKNKTTGTYRMKIDIEDREAFSKTHTEMKSLYNKQYPYVGYASEPGTSGGQLYELWGESNYKGKLEPVAKANARIEEMITAIIKYADKGV